MDNNVFGENINRMSASTFFFSIWGLKKKKKKKKKKKIGPLRTFSFLFVGGGTPKWNAQNVRRPRIPPNYFVCSLFLNFLKIVPQKAVPLFVSSVVRNNTSVMSAGRSMREL